MDQESPLRILLVEDNSFAAYATRLILDEVRQLRCEVDCAASLADAVRRVDGASFDLVILDLQLPDSDGLATVQAMRRACGFIPIIVLTSYDDDDLAELAISAGAQDYLVKGKFDGDAIARAIRHAVVRSWMEEQVSERTRALDESRRNLQRAQAVAGIGSWNLDLRSSCLTWSDETCRIFGAGDGRPLPHADFLARVHPDERAKVDAAWQMAVINGNNFDLTYRIVIDGRIKWVRELAEFSFDAQDRPRSAIGTVQDISERKRSELEYQAIIRTTMEGFWINDLEGRILDVNEAYCKLIGYSRQELLGMSILNLDAKESPEETIDHLHQILQGGGDRFETRHRCKDGRILDVEVSANLLSKVGGRVVAFMRDISERKQKVDGLAQSLREKEAMLQEIHHRVKNNLQVVSSLLSLQSREITDPAVLVMFAECQNRVNAMATVHEKLYRSADLAQVDFKEYLDDLVAMIMGTYHRPQVVCVVEMASVAIGVDQGIPCGLIVNELVSNSFKHAFPKGRGGTVRVGLRLEPQGGYLLDIQDDGIGLMAGMDFRRTSSLGLQLVNVLVGQLRGTIELIGVEQGLGYRICFPKKS